MVRQAAKAWPELESILVSTAGHSWDGWKVEAMKLRIVEVARADIVDRLQSHHEARQLPEYEEQRQRHYIEQLMKLWAGKRQSSNLVNVRADDGSVTRGQ